VKIFYLSHHKNNIHYNNDHADGAAYDDDYDDYDDQKL
jgi:hypothetical protein